MCAATGSRGRRTTGCTRQFPLLLSLLLLLLYVSLSIHIYLYIYIYIERERCIITIIIITIILMMVTTNMLIHTIILYGRSLSSNSRQQCISVNGTLPPFTKWPGMDDRAWGVVYIYIYIYMYVCIYIYIHTHLHTYIHTSIHTRGTPFGDHPL